MNERPVILTARRICKTFPSGEKQLEVLRGVDLELRDGESLSVRGESGCGKTTLVHILAGLEPFDSGSLFWERTELSRRATSSLAARRATFIGMVFQSFYLVPELSAYENVLLAARIAGDAGREKRERAHSLLEKVGLSGRSHHLPTQLSGGEKQRVGVARSLMNRPRLIFADEPTGNLDEKTGKAIIELLLNVTRDEGAALVLVTHNRHHAALTDRALILHLGRMEEGSANLHTPF